MHHQKPNKKWLFWSKANHVISPFVWQSAHCLILPLWFQPSSATRNTNRTPSMLKIMVAYTTRRTKPGPDSKLLTRCKNRLVGSWANRCCRQLRHFETGFGYVVMPSLSYRPRVCRLKGLWNIWSASWIDVFSLFSHVLVSSFSLSFCAWGRSTILLGQMDQQPSMHYFVGLLTTAAVSWTTRRLGRTAPTLPWSSCSMTFMSTMPSAGLVLGHTLCTSSMPI